MSTALSSPVLVPPQEETRVWAHFPEQRLVIEPRTNTNNDVFTVNEAVPNQNEG